MRAKARWAREVLLFLLVTGSATLTPCPTAWSQAPPAGEELPPPCPEPGSPDYADTHCAGIEVIADGLPEGVTHLVRAIATDDTGDTILYLFTAVGAERGDVTMGPTAESEVEFSLPDGLWAFTVDVFDDMDCWEGTLDARCSFVPPGYPAFRRGDKNGDGEVTISDAIGLILLFFWLEGPPPPCEDAVDSDDNGALNLTDAIRILNVLFLGIGTIPPPGALECGIDPTDDPLGCVLPSC